MTELIKTQKQYEETLDFLKINRFAYDEANEIEDLIEALREVARDVLYIKKGWHMCRLCNEASPDGPVHEEHCPMNALPDWLVDA